MNIKGIIREEISRLFEEEDLDWDLYENMGNVLRDVIERYKDALEKGGGKQPWTVIPFLRLKKIWEDYIRYGVVHDEKGIDMIEAIFTKNVLKLNANTELAGHANSYPTEEIEDAGMTEDDLWDNGTDFDFGDYIAGPNGQPRISDYGLEPLFKLTLELRKESSYEKKLPILDKMLNVSHMRSDLAEMFIEGGSYSLDKLSGYYDDDAKSVISNTQLQRNTSF